VEELVAGTEAPLTDWQRSAEEVQWQVHTDRVEVVLGWGDLTKRIFVRAGGVVEVSWEWDPTAWEAGSVFTSEWSCFAPLAMETDAAERWSYVVETVAKSERGLDRTAQGEAVVLRWPVAAGRGWVRA
jgi:hypothetical protein